MAVVSSSFALDPVIQADGSRWCVETHQLTGGTTAEFYYLLAEGDNATSIMNARAVSLAFVAAEKEADINMERDGGLTLNHQTGTQFMARLREAIRQASQGQACYLAWWLLRRIAAGHITDTQCQTAFGLNSTQWTNLKTNTLTPRSNAWAAQLAAAGV